MEAVTHALHWIASRGDIQTTHAIILTDSVSLLQKSEKWNGKAKLVRVDGRHPPSKTPVRVLPWTCRSEGKRPSRWTGGQSNPHMLRSLRHYLRAQSQGHHTIDRLEERGVERGSARRSSFKGRERVIVNQTNTGTVSKVTLGKLLRDGEERIWAFPSA